jgi:YfiH family protein
MPTFDQTWIVPDWPAPAGVHAAVSTRDGPGRSVAPYQRCNLGMRSGDEPSTVQANRDALADALALPASPHWLQQVHGTDVVRIAGPATDAEPVADAAVTAMPGQPLAILTADCLPVLLCDEAGTTIGAAHAGWRGLLAGVIERTVTAMDVAPAHVLAWLGPCIGAASYEVGEEVRSAFVERDAVAVAAFVPTRPGHWLCDLAMLARQRLGALGVRRVHGGGFDTFGDARFYSYRRDGARSGRFASLIWLERH